MLTLKFQIWSFEEILNEIIKIKNDDIKNWIMTNWIIIIKVNKSKAIWKQQFINDFNELEWKKILLALTEKKVTNYTIKIEINVKIEKFTCKRFVEIVLKVLTLMKNFIKDTLVSINFWIELESKQIHLLTSIILIKHCWIADNAMMNIVEIRMTSVSWILQTSTIIWITLSNLYEIKWYLTTKQTSALNDLLSFYITFEVINRALLSRCLIDQIYMRKDWTSKQSEWKRKILWRDLWDSMNSKWKCKWVRQWLFR